MIVLLGSETVFHKMVSSRLRVLVTSLILQFAVVACCHRWAVVRAVLISRFAQHDIRVAGALETVQHRATDPMVRRLGKILNLRQCKAPGYYVAYH